MALIPDSLPPWGGPTARVGWSKNTVNVHCSEFKVPAFFFNEDDRVSAISGTRLNDKDEKTEQTLRALTFY